MNTISIISEALNKIGATSEEVDYNKRGYHLESYLDADKVRDMAKLLLEEEFYLSFVTAVHVEPAIEVIYQFAHFETLCRINIRAVVNPDNSVPTISDIFHGADWHERETKDFYGVIFTGHKNLIPLILDDDDVDLKPLLKNEKKLKKTEEVRWAKEPAEDEKPKGETSPASSTSE